MIVKEPYGHLPDGTELERTYSNQKKFIHKVGTNEMYEEAVDRVPVEYLYEETTLAIETNDPAEREDNV